MNESTEDTGTAATADAGTASAYIVREVVEADWPQLRELRLEMLADTPIAYGETLDVALTHEEPEWRMRARRGLPEHTILLTAIHRETGRWVGTMGGFVQREPGAQGPLLVGVYVSPEHRGRSHGVAEAMIGRVEQWAAGEADSLRLIVHEDNARAIGFYRRLGYVPNGRTIPYVLDRTRRELELEKPLR